MRKIANDSTSMASRVRIGSIIAAAGTATLYAAFASLGAQAVAAVASMGPMVGLLASLPSLLFAAVPGVAALLLAFSGLGAALKTTAGGAGQSASAIAAAEHRIEIAQRNAVRAQQDLNEARATAVERLQDVQRELARARLDEEGAVLAVADAERALRAARRSGDRQAREHADLNYREAVQSLDEVRARLADVTDEEEKRRTAGVEGSDEVQTALQRQADATYELAQAQEALKQAQSGGGGVDKAAEAYAKLTAEGKALVDVLKAIAPAWRGVQQAVQARVLAGVAESVRLLSDAYLPVMLTQLPAIGQGWNNAFNGTAKLAASEGFVKDINDALAKTAIFWQKVGDAFAPFLSGFRHFVVVGADFLPRIGDWVRRIAERFDRWAESARNTGKAHDWIEKGAEVFGQWWQIAKNLGSSIVAIFKAGSGGPDWLPGLVEGTGKLREWLESPAGQGKLAEVFSTLRDIGSKLWLIVTKVGEALVNTFTGPDAVDVRGMVDDLGTILGFMAEHLDDIAAALPLLALGFVAYRSSIVGITIVEAIRLPILAATAIANWRLASAMGAATAATGAQTVATTAGALSLGAILGIIALFIVAIALMALEIWFMVKNFDNAMLFVRKSWDWWWDQIIGRAKSAVAWIIDMWDRLVNWFQGLRISVPGLWDGIWWAFRNALNNIIWAWNRLEFTVPTFNFLGITAGGFSIGTPDIPYLDTGGRVLSDGLAFIHRGEEVVPAAQVTRGGGAQEIVLRIDVTGADQDMKRMVRKMIRGVAGSGSGSVQLALGQ